MERSFKKIWMIAVIVLGLLVSALGVTPALADDGTPPVLERAKIETPITDEPVVTETPVLQEPVATASPALAETIVTEEPLATEEPAATETPVATEEPPATEAPAATESPVVNEEPVATEVPVVKSSERAASVFKALTQLPAETAVVVLDEAGNPEPLVTQEAADIVQNSDPLWCPEGVTPTPGAGGCTASYGSLTDLLSYLDLNEPAQAGVIWIEGGYDSSVNDPGFVNSFILTGGTGGQFFTMSQYNLTIQGGWSGGNDTLVDHNNPSVFNGDLLAIWEWQGNLTINDIQIVNNPDHTGLTANTNGNLAMDHVTASNNHEIGADVIANGNITISNSTFNSNGPTSWSGTCGVLCPLPPLRYYFFADGDAGLEAASTSGSVTLNNVTATGNINGAEISAAGEIDVTDSHFDENGGRFTLYQLQFLGGTPFLSPVYSYSVGSGLMATSANGGVTLNRTTASGNIINGAEIGTAQGNVFAGCSQFVENGGYGLDAHNAVGSLTLGNVTFGGNVVGDYAHNGEVIITNDCTPPSSGSSTSTASGEEDSDVTLYYLVQQAQDQLPAALGAGNVFVSALQVVLTSAGEKVTNLAITLSFPIPEGVQADKLAVLFWDGTAWLEVTGGQVIGDYFVVTVDKPGYYVLVSQ